ncbi:hypothetical protein GNI_152560, partial [Gregarina niphandrodes]
MLYAITFHLGRIIVKLWRSRTVIVDRSSSPRVTRKRTGFDVLEWRRIRKTEKNRRPACSGFFDRDGSEEKDYDGRVGGRVGRSINEFHRLLSAVTNHSDGVSREERVQDWTLNGAPISFIYQRPCAPMAADPTAAAMLRHILDIDPDWDLGWGGGGTGDMSDSTCSWESARSWESSGCETHNQQCGYAHNGREARDECQVYDAGYDGEHRDEYVGERRDEYVEECRDEYVGECRDEYGDGEYRDEYVDECRDEYSDGLRRRCECGAASCESGSDTGSDSGSERTPRVWRPAFVLDVRQEDTGRLVFRPTLASSSSFPAESVSRGVCRGQRAWRVGLYEKWAAMAAEELPELDGTAMAPLSPAGVRVRDASHWNAWPVARGLATENALVSALGDRSGDVLSMLPGYRVSYAGPLIGGGCARFESTPTDIVLNAVLTTGHRSGTHTFELFNQLIADLYARHLSAQTAQLLYNRAAEACTAITRLARHTDSADLALRTYGKQIRSTLQFRELQRSSTQQGRDRDRDRRLAQLNQVLCSPLSFATPYGNPYFAVDPPPREPGATNLNEEHLHGVYPSGPYPYAPYPYGPYPYTPYPYGPYPDAPYPYEARVFPSGHPPSGAYPYGPEGEAEGCERLYYAIPVRRWRPSDVFRMLECFENPRRIFLPPVAKDLKGERALYLRRPGQPRNRNMELGMPQIPYCPHVVVPPETGEVFLPAVECWNDWLESVDYAQRLVDLALEDDRCRPTCGCGRLCQAFTPEARCYQLCKRLYKTLELTYLQFLGNLVRIAHWSLHLKQFAESRSTDRPAVSAKTRSAGAPSAETSTSGTRSGDWPLSAALSHERRCGLVWHTCLYSFECSKAQFERLALETVPALLPHELVRHHKNAAAALEELRPGALPRCSQRLAAFGLSADDPATCRQELEHLAHEFAVRTLRRADVYGSAFLTLPSSRRQKPEAGGHVFVPSSLAVEEASRVGVALAFKETHLRERARRGPNPP